MFVQFQNNGVPKAGIHGRRCAQSYFGWPFTCERWGTDQSLKITLRRLSLYHHSSFHAPSLLFKGKSLVSMLFLSCLTVCRGNQRSTSEVFYVREQRALEESFDLSKWKGCSLPLLEFLFIFACFQAWLMTLGHADMGYREGNDRAWLEPHSGWTWLVVTVYCVRCCQCIVPSVCQRWPGVVALHSHKHAYLLIYC